MDNSEKELIITILNKKNNGKYQNHLNEEKSIEKIKEDCRQDLGLKNIDINEINLYFIDKDNDKNIINEFSDLIEFSNINSKNNLSIELNAEISEEKENGKNKENNPIYINNNKNSSKIIVDDKDRKINELTAKNEILIMKLQKYKDIIKKLINKYEKLINDLKKVDSKRENKEVPYENNNINEKFQNKNINNLNLKSNDINSKGKNNLYLQFILTKCNNCQKLSEKNIYKCVSCKNYYLCQECFKENNKKNKAFHKHEYLYFFEIKFPKELKYIVKNELMINKFYNEVTGKFNTLLNNIFFDTNGNFSNKEYNSDKPHLEQLQILYNEMNKINEEPFKYFEDYKISYINPELEKIEKEGNQKEIMLLVSKKLFLFGNNLMSCIPKEKTKIKLFYVL